MKPRAIHLLGFEYGCERPEKGLAVLSPDATGAVDPQLEPLASNRSDQGREVAVAGRRPHFAQRTRNVGKGR